MSCKKDTTTNGPEKSTLKADDYTLKIDSLIQTKNPRQFNGVILITKNGDTQYSKAFGYSDFEQKTHLSLDDNFRIQSNSKQITAVLILKEVEKGKLKLDVPIREYLPEMDQDWMDRVTIHHLLNMSSGISSLEKPLDFEPGEKFQYSNPNYFLLGKIYKKVTGELVSLAANRLFKQLGMNNSFSFELDETKNQVVKGYINTDNTFEYFDFFSDKVGFTEESWNNFIPTGGYISNLKDLSIWDTKLHNGVVLSKESYQTMTRTELLKEDEIFGTMGYGYGLLVNNTSPVKYMGHAGSGLGSVSIKIYIPELDVNLIVLENQYIRNDRSKLYHFEKQLREIVLNSSLVR